MTKSLGWACVCALLWSCGGGTAETEGQEMPDGDSGGEEEAEADPFADVPGPPKPWEEMTTQEKRRHMGLEVLPRMADLFTEYDSERFGDFSCETCHGEDPADREYAMPNPDILVLWPTGHPENLALRSNEEMRPILPFMFGKVVPTMQRLLGQPEFDTETGEGFTCFFCHTNGADAEAAGGESEGEGEAGGEGEGEEAPAEG